MISTEQAFDILPYVAEIYEKINIDKFRDKHIKKGMTQKQAGIKLFILCKESKKIKKEVFEIDSILEGISIEEAKKNELIKTLNNLKEIFTDKDLLDFFKSAME